MNLEKRDLFARIRENYSNYTGKRIHKLKIGNCQAMKIAFVHCTESK